MIASISLISLAMLASACGTDAPAPPANPSSIPTSEPTNDGEAVESFLPVDTGAALPALSEAEVAVLLTEVTAGIDTWFGLAGLAKAIAPPPLTTAIEDYREAWSLVNPDVATFLGTWRNLEDYPYYLSIFPATTPGQVCVLAFKPEWSLQILNEETGEYAKDVISEQILSFSVATVADGHLRSSQLRSVGAATVLARYTVGEAYPVMFMGVIDQQATTRVVALTAPPSLPVDLPAALVPAATQALSDHGCTTDLTPPQE